VGRPPKIESPEMLYELFQQYKKDVKSTPILVHDFVGKDASEVRREKEKPLTFEGFECFVWDKGISKGIDHIFSNQGGRYKRFLSICSRIKKEIRADQIQGGMAGIYNPSITQRLNNLVDKVEQTVIEQPLFADDESDTEEND
jgi:hypothetical protein